MREPKPIFRKQAQSQYVQLGRKQINLGKDEAAAREKYHRLLADFREHQEVAPSNAPPIEIALDG